MTQISLELPDEWVAYLDERVKQHVLGAKTRQDVIRMILDTAMQEAKRLFPEVKNLPTSRLYTSCAQTGKEEKKQ